MIVRFFSALKAKQNWLGGPLPPFLTSLIVDNVCRKRNCSATGDCATINAASLSAFDAFCSPSAAIIFAIHVFGSMAMQTVTLAPASRVASASAAIARCSWTGSRTSFISTLSTFPPPGFVISSRVLCICREICSRSLHNNPKTIYPILAIPKRHLNISASVLVPRMLRSVVWARSFVERLESSTFVTEMVAFEMRK